MSGLDCYAAPPPAVYTTAARPPLRSVRVGASRVLRAIVIFGPELVRRVLVVVFIARAPATIRLAATAAAAAAATATPRLYRWCTRLNLQVDLAVDLAVRAA